jgi:hypothetical protein
LRFQSPPHAFFGQLAAQLVVVGPIHVQEIRSLTRHATNERASDVASTTGSSRAHGADHVRQVYRTPTEICCSRAGGKSLRGSRGRTRVETFYAQSDRILGGGSDIWPSRSFLRMLRQMSSLPKSGVPSGGGVGRNWRSLNCADLAPELNLLLKRPARTFAVHHWLAQQGS